MHVHTTCGVEVESVLTARWSIRVTIVWIGPRVVRVVESGLHAKRLAIFDDKFWLLVHPTISIFCKVIIRIQAEVPPIHDMSFRLLGQLWGLKFRRPSRALSCLHTLRFFVLPVKTTIVRPYLVKEVLRRPCLFHIDDLIFIFFCLLGQTRIQLGSPSIVRSLVVGVRELISIGLVGHRVNV